METCPTCCQESEVLITNLQTGQQFCHRCAGTVCPTFMPGLVYNSGDIKFLRDCGIDPEVGKIEDHLRTHCKRPSGTERAWFRTRAEAVAFAEDPKNPAYHGDIPALCARCDLYHLNRPEWLEPMLTHRDAALLESIGIEAPAKAPGDLKCGQCGVAFRTGIDFLILPDGNMVCGTDCAAR
jgi:hypothetical protein